MKKIEQYEGKTITESEWNKLVKQIQFKCDYYIGPRTTQYSNVVIGGSGSPTIKFFVKNSKKTIKCYSK